MFSAYFLRTFRRSAALFSLALSMFALANCQSDLSTSLEGRECDQNGQCLDGYVCDPASRLCVPNGGGSSTPVPTGGCTAPQIACGDGCVDPAQDARHCGGCGATC